MKPAFSHFTDESAIEIKTVMAVEKVIRKVRAFTSMVVGNRVEADEIVEDALILYLATDPEPEESDKSYAYLITAVRRLMRTYGAQARRGSDLDPALVPLLQLPLDTREIAALHLGAQLSLADTASLLGLTPEEATAGLVAVRQTIGAEAYDRIAPAV
jgi:hypothetical protein